MTTAVSQQPPVPTVAGLVPEARLPLEQRAAALRLDSPAAYGAVVTHADALERQGVAADVALDRALAAVGR